MKHNQENCEKLAKVIVDSWDMKGLEQFAIDNLAEDVKNHKVELKGG